MVAKCVAIFFTIVTGSNIYIIVDACNPSEFYFIDKKEKSISTTFETHHRIGGVDN